jgi:NlpC/P60 family
VVIHAMAMLDRGYTYGGKKLHTGFDCSGLVSFVYKESAGIPIKASQPWRLGVFQHIGKPVFACWYLHWFWQIHPCCQ